MLNLTQGTQDWIAILGNGHAAAAYRSWRAYFGTIDLIFVIIVNVPGQRCFSA